MISVPGVVADEKLRPTTSMSGKALNAENRVIVFPEPGGPQRTKKFMFRYCWVLQGYSELKAEI